MYYFKKEELKFADLHTHTTYSDGTFKPAELVVYAARQNICVLSITDHDSVSGIDEAIEAGFSAGVEIIPGIELNTDIRDAEIHILGYFMNYKDAGFVKHLNALRSSRIGRMEQMVAKLNSLGHRISIDDVYVEARSSSNPYEDVNSIGRPHLARALLKKGIVEDERAAFDRYIGNGKPCYVEAMNKLSPPDAVRMIVEFNGIPVLAHPGLSKRDDLIPVLIKNGLRGIEVYHSSHDADNVRKYENMARGAGLLLTGGSDCHGPRGPQQPSCGNIRLPLARVEELKNAAKTGNRGV